MPEKPFSIAVYAVGASLAAISLLYVFGPNFTLDASSSKQSRIVGLCNPANDCFINSVLQALANMTELREFLIRETHRRKLDGSAVYQPAIDAVSEQDVDQDSQAYRQARKDHARQHSLDCGVVTIALKDMLDRLNERPFFKKTISAYKFIQNYELAEGYRISCQQQDAQEFLQYVLQRLDAELIAGKKARDNFRRGSSNSLSPVDTTPPIGTAPLETDFPFEGKLKSQLQCKVCGFETKPYEMPFVVLTLNVPQVRKTTLSSCLNFFKSEALEDFKCEKCCLNHAKQAKLAQLKKSPSEKVQADLEAISHALDNDPHVPLPPSVEMPSNPPHSATVKTTRISSYPQILVVHFSRSIYSESSSSRKNTVKVAFPENLHLGGLLSGRKYYLQSVITHSGAHNMGHYVTYRRQIPVTPVNSKYDFGTTGPYSRRSSPLSTTSTSTQDDHPATTTTTSPTSKAKSQPSTSSTIEDVDGKPARTHPQSNSNFVPRLTASSLHSAQSLSKNESKFTVSSSPVEKAAPFFGEVISPASEEVESTTIDEASSVKTYDSQVPESDAPNSPLSMSRHQGPEGDADRSKMAKQREKMAQHWWAVSDDLVRECKTDDVLGKQQGVYMLFYELVETTEAEDLSFKLNFNKSAEQDVDEDQEEQEQEQEEKEKGKEKVEKDEDKEYDGELVNFSKFMRVMSWSL